MKTVYFINGMTIELNNEEAANLHGEIIKYKIFKDDLVLLTTGEFIRISQIQAII